MSVPPNVALCAGIHEAQPNRASAIVVVRTVGRRLAAPAPSTMSGGEDAGARSKAMPLSLRLLILIALVVARAPAADYYVSPSGSDAGAGTLAAPFLTIQKAADVMQAGDTVFIRAGLYREWVKPPRGGTGETARISYRAYPGERPEIKGSEVVVWTREGGNVWKATIPNPTFGNWNPYTLKVSGPYLTSGGNNHLGEVYLNGSSLDEKTAKADVTTTANTWYTEQDGADTVIWANFDGADPNAGLAEINVRQAVFAPTATKLNYITIDGLTMRHAATQWNANTNFQHGMIHLMGGHHWVIENCRLSDSKTTGITAALQSDDHPMYDSVGHHIVRNCLIERCGEQGVSGKYGWTASLIDGNIIQNIAIKQQFGGWEPAGLKMHQTVDLTIRNNIIRRIRGVNVNGSCHAIWADWQCGGWRISGNIIYEFDGVGIVFEMDRGVNLADNNIIIGRNGASHAILACSERIVQAHNLFCNADAMAMDLAAGRAVGWFAPHSLMKGGGGGGNGALHRTSFDKIYNNINVKKGYLGTPFNNAPDFQADCNVYWQGAEKTGAAEPNSVVNGAYSLGLLMADDAQGVTMRITADSAALKRMTCPLISASFLGIIGSLQAIEDAHGSPITIDKDILGKSRNGSRPTAGPLEDLASGPVAFYFAAGPRTAIETPVTGVQLSRTTAVLDSVGASLALMPSVAPTNATNPRVAWISSDPSVAVVGPDGVVTAVGSGTATIIAVTVDGSRSAACQVTVTTAANTAPADTRAKPARLPR